MNILTVLAAVMWLRASNFVLFIGMMRAGGDALCWLMDVVALWGVGVPACWVYSFFICPCIIYLLVMTEEALKFRISIWRYRSNAGSMIW